MSHRVQDWTCVGGPKSSYIRKSFAYVVGEFLRSRICEYSFLFRAFASQSYARRDSGNAFVRIIPASALTCMMIITVYPFSEVAQAAASILLPKPITD